MKATIERATLLKGLGHVHSVVERRNTIPILSNVLIEAEEEGGLRLMATDLDLQINERVEANVADPGATTVPAHTLFDIVRKLPEGSQVELIAAEGRMQVNAGRARFTLATLPRDDFPVIAEGDLPDSPDWARGATFYQIFPERFARSTDGHRRAPVDHWDGPVDASSFLGGDLDGITQHLDYVASMSVDALYLTPIFSSPSSHKYDTSDYFTGDPDEEPLRWSVHDMRRKDFWGASVVPSWYTDATDVLDLHGDVSPVRAIDMSTSEGAVGADGLR